MFPSLSLSIYLSLSLSLSLSTGRPWLPPYWSLGLMQSKYGYQSIDECETAVNGYRDAKIPLETFVSDSQYMVLFRILFPLLFFQLCEVIAQFWVSERGGLEGKTQSKTPISGNNETHFFPLCSTLDFFSNKKKNVTGRGPGLHPRQALPAAPHEGLRRQAPRQRPALGPDPRPRHPRPQRLQALRRRDACRRLP